MTKLMTTKQPINEQTKHDHIFCHVIRDRKLATKTVIWLFICEFLSFVWSLISHLLATYLSFFGH